jgi:hypothetical protein
MIAIGRVPLLIAAVIAPVLITVALVLLELRWGWERFDEVVGGGRHKAKPEL